MTGTSRAMIALAWLNRAARCLALSVTSVRFSRAVTRLLQYVMLFDGFRHPSHGTVKLESGEVTHAYSDMSQLPAELLCGPSPHRTFGSTSRMLTSIPICL